MISFLNFDGSSVGLLPAGFTNTTTVPGHRGNYKVGTSGSISSPNSLYDAGGLSGGSVLWTNLLAADEAVQFNQVVHLSGGVINPLIRMNATGQTGYGAFISWSTPKIDFVVVNSNGTTTTLASPAIPAYSDGARVTIKLEIQGSNLRFKSWITGSAEPTSWTATTTDSTITTAGYPGLSSAGGTIDDIYFGPAGSTFSGGFIPPVLSAGTTTWSQAQVSWTASAQFGGSPTYQLMRSIHGANSFTPITGAAYSPAIDTTVAASTSYDYMVRASDGVNSPVNSNVITLAVPSIPAATSYTLTGPAFGLVGKPSAAFTVAPNGTWSGSITIRQSGSGLSTPIILTFSSSSVPKTFTLAPSTLGPITLTATNTGSLQDPPALSYLSTSAMPSVSGSGRSLVLLGSNTVTGVNYGNDTQILTIHGTPAGNAFSLGFGGQTTTPIAATTTIPSRYGLYTIPVTPGLPIVLAMNLVLDLSFNPNPHTLVQIFDGGNMVSSQEANLATGTPDYLLTDTTSGHPGNVLSMKNLGTFTPVSSQIQLYYTQTGFDINTNVFCDLVTVTPVATGVTQYYDDSSTYFSSQSWYAPGNSHCYNNQMHMDNQATNGGVKFSANSSDLQSALQSLSNIGVGNVTVTGNNPFTISFTGTLSQSAQPAITCSDPSITLVHSFVGGALPTLNVTPLTGSPYSFSPARYIWGTGIGAGQSGSNVAPYGNWLFCRFSESTPTHLYYAFGQGLISQQGDYPQFNSGGLSGRASRSTLTGAVTTTYAEGIPPGTYQIGWTWPADNTLCTAAQYTITSYPDGANLASGTVDQSVAPSDFVLKGASFKTVASVTTTSLSTGIVITITNPGGNVAFDVFVITRTSPDLSNVIPPGATVQFTAPAGFITTADGPSPAFSATIPNLSGQSSYAPGGYGSPLPTPVTMPVGGNAIGDSYYSAGLQFNNLAGRIQFPVNNAIASNALRYPTLLSSQISNYNYTVSGAPDINGLGLGLDAAPSGLWTFRWDCPTGNTDSAQPSPGTSPFTEATQYQVLTGTTKQRVFNIQADPRNSLGISLLVQLASGSAPDGNGHYPMALSNLRIYPPDPSDPTGMTPQGLINQPTPPKFTPNFLTQIGNGTAIRFLGYSPINGNGFSELADYRQANSLRGNNRELNLTVTSIRGYTGSALMDPTLGWIIEITVADTSGIFNMMPMTLNFSGTITMANSDTYTGTVGGLVMIKSSTVIQMQILYGEHNTTMANTLTSGTLVGSAGTDQSIQDHVDLCNVKNQACWFQIPMSVSNQGMIDICNYLCTHLNPNLDIYAEAGNENWNFQFTTGGWASCRILSYQLGGSVPGAGSSFAPGQVDYSRRYWAAMQTAATAAGRTGKVYRVLGTQATNPGVTTTLLALCVTQGITFDYLAPADYFTPNVNASVANEPQFRNDFDLMGPYGTPFELVDTSGGQSMDWHELVTTVNQNSLVNLGGHRAALDATRGTAHDFSGIKIAAYEAGDGVMTPGASGVNGPFRSHVILRHPRNFNCELAMLNQSQAAGCTLYMKFFALGHPYLETAFPNVTLSEWGAYCGWNMQPGTGNYSSDVVNLTNPEQVDLIKSEVGGALRYWNSMIASASGGSSPRFGSSQITTTGAKPHGVSRSARGGKTA